MTGVTIEPMNSVMTADQSTEVANIFSKVFNAIIDFLYTMVFTLLDFFTNPDVLGSVVTIALIYWAYKMFKRKSLS